MAMSKAVWLTLTETECMQGQFLSTLAAWYHQYTRGGDWEGMEHTKEVIVFTGQISNEVVDLNSESVVIII